MRAGRLMAAVPDNTPLIVRASLARTFWTLGLFVEAGLVFSGIYLLADELNSPLEANQAAVICAGVLLSLATMLLFCLIGPRRFTALAKEDKPPGEEKLLEVPLTAYGETIQARHRAALELEKDTLPGPM